MRFQDITQHTDTPIFSPRDLTREGGRINQSQLSQWVKKGQLVKLRNGLYALHTSLRRIKASGAIGPAMLTLEQISQYLPPLWVNRNPRAAIVEYL